MNNINLNINDAKKKVKEVIDNGKAAENFEKMVFELGGPSKILTNYSEILPKANYVQDIFAEKEGYVEAINTRMLGLILIELGGGRKYSSSADCPRKLVTVHWGPTYVLASKSFINSLISLALSSIPFSNFSIFFSNLLILFFLAK